MEAKQTTLLDLIQAEAKTNVGKYNLIKNEAVREAKIMHHNVCKKLITISTEKNISMSHLVYIAIGTNAHKRQVFERGYAAIDEKTLDRVISLVDIFAKKFGEESRSNEKLIHAVHRYVKHDGGVLKFKQMVNHLANENPQFAVNKTKSAKDLARAIYGDLVSYTKGGYLLEVGKPSRFIE